MGGFTIYTISYPDTSREEVLFHANLSVRNLMLECMLKAHTDGLRAGVVSKCPDCATAVAQRQLLLRAAEDTLQWLTQLPSSVQALSDLIAMISGDNNYERRWMGGYNDRQVAEAKFSQLVQTMSDCEDEFLYLQDDQMVCDHEHWYRPGLGIGSMSTSNELGLWNPVTERSEERQSTEEDAGIVLEVQRGGVPDGLAIYRIKHVEKLFHVNLPVRNVILECMLRANTDGFEVSRVSRCPECMTSILERRPLLNAAEETLRYVKHLPASVQDFTDMMAIATGDYDYRRSWEGGCTDRQVAEMSLPHLLQALRRCRDETIYLEDRYALCAHEFWHRPE